MARETLPPTQTDDEAVLRELFGEDVVGPPPAATAPPVVTPEPDDAVLRELFGADVIDAAREESFARQRLRGLPEPIEVPTMGEVGEKQNAVWNLVYEQERLGGMSEPDARAEAWRVVSSGMGSRAKSDTGKLALGLADDAVAGAAEALGRETAAGRIVEAMGPQRYGAEGRMDVPKYRLAETDSERAIGEGVRAANLYRSGMSMAEAKRQARLEAERGLVLIENPQSGRIGTAAETELNKRTPSLPETFGQAAVDIARGANVLAVDALNLAKDVAVDAPLAAMQATAEAADRAMGGVLPVDAGSKANRAVRDYVIPSPFDAAVEAGLLSDTALGEAMASSRERGAGIVAGVVGAAQKADRAVEASPGLAALPGGAPFLLVDAPDPQGAGVLNRVVRDLMSVSENRIPVPDKDGVQMIEDAFGGVTRALAARGAASEKMAAADTAEEKVKVGVGVATEGAAALTSPVMDAFAATMYPSNRESTIGQAMRVGGSLLQGLVTTQLGRTADYFLRRAGAVSYRTGRGPDPATDTPGAVDLVLGPFLPGSGYWHDYATSLENGEGVTNEVMHAMETYAKGMPGLTPEQREAWLPGGVYYDAGVQVGMLGDLIIPLDNVPIAGVRQTAGRGVRFTNGMVTATNAGVGWKDAAVVGAAQALPTWTDRALRGDAAYTQGRDAFRQATDAAATQAATSIRGEPTTVRTEDIDPSTVTLGVLYRWAKRQGNAGKSLAEFSAKLMPYGQTLVTDQMREVLTTLGVEPDEVAREAMRESGEQGSRVAVPDEATAGTLARLGYPQERIVAMSPEEARQRAEEGIRPGENPDELPDAPMPRADIEAGLDRLVRVADAEQKPPLGTVPDVVAKIEDPAERAGATLAAVAQHLGVSADSVWVRLALQAALSFYDRSSGRMVRVPFPTLEVLNAVKQPHLDAALKRLLRASPETVWKATRDFHRGETVWFVDDVALDDAARRAAEAVTLPPGSKVLDVLPADSELRAALSTVTDKGPWTPYQRIATAGADWIQRAIDAERLVARELKKALVAADAAWARVSDALNVDPLVEPPLTVVDALDRELQAGTLTGPLEARARQAVEDARTLASRAERSKRRVASMVAYVEALLLAEKPKREATPTRKLPSREKVRITLRRMAREGKVAYTPEQVDLYLTVWDRVAESLVEAGQIAKADDWWGRVDFQQLRPDTRPDALEVDGGERKGLIEFLEDGRAIIELGARADLSTLFHESAHLLRRVVPADKMASVDAYVRETFGGWTREAEEWFAEQMEWVFSTGSLRASYKGRSVPSMFVAALNRALRLAARVLADVLSRSQGPMRRAGMEFSPVVEKWAADFLRLDTDRVLSKEPVTELRVEEPVDGSEPRKRLIEARRAEARAVKEREAAFATARTEAENYAPAFVKALDEARAGRDAPPPPELPRTVKKPVGIVQEAAQPVLPGVPRPEASKRKQAPEKGPHDPSFAADRNAFMAAVTAAGFRYDDVARWTESQGRGRPSAWTNEDRRALVAELQKPETRAAVEAVKPQAALPLAPKPESIVADPRGVRLAEEALERASEALVDAVVARKAPATILKLQRAFLDSAAVLQAIERGEKPPEDARAYREKVLSVEQTTDFKRGLNAAKRKDLDETARRELVQAAVDAVVESVLVPRGAEVVPPKVVQAALAPDALPPLETPPAGLRPEDAVQITGRVGTPTHTEAGLARVLVDAKNVRYRYRVATMPVSAVLVSHTDALAPTPGYPQEYQQRSDALARDEKMEDISRNLQVDALTHEGQTPTTGAPTLWYDADGQAITLAGNGRMIAIRRAFRRDDANAAAYRAMVQATAQALGLPQPGPDHVLVRILDIAPDDPAAAVSFAQNSQKSPAEALKESEELDGVASTIRAKLQGQPPVRLDVSAPPVALDATVAGMLLRENPDLMAAMIAVEPNAASRDRMIEADPVMFVRTVRGILLGTLDADTVRSGQSVGALVPLADAVPALGAIAKMAAERPSLVVADISRYLKDALDLLQAARAEGAETPKAMEGLIGNLIRRVGFTTARPIPVSKVSAAVAMALSKDPKGFTRRVADVLNGLRADVQPSFFGAQMFDPAKVVVDAMTTKAQRAAFPDDLPWSHEEAVTRANELQAASIENAERARNAADPLPEDPPALRVLESRTDILESRRQNVESIGPGVAAAVRGSPEGAAVRQVVEQPQMKDDYYSGKAATPDFEEPKDTKGFLYKMARGAPGLDRTQLKVALGYAPDQRTYDAVDLQARAFAYVLTRQLQSGQGRSWRRMGKVAAVPQERVAAVKQRALTLVKPIADEVATAARVSTPAPDAPVNLPLPVAERIRTLLDYLDRTGHAETLPRSLMARTAGGLAETMTLLEWDDIVDAVYDSVSGALPFRGRVEPYSLAAVWLYNLTQRYGGMLVPDLETRATSRWRRFVNETKRIAGSVALQVGSLFLAYEDYQPHMAEWLRPIWQRYHREMGSEPAALIDRLERALTGAQKSPRAMADALSAMRDEPAFQSIVSVDEVNGPSDLRQLRGWLYAPVGNAPYTGAPLPRFHDLADANNGVWPTHDLPLDPANAPTVNDLYARSDLVERVLMRDGGMQPHVLELVTQLRQRTLTPDGAAIIVALLYDRLNACAVRGREILISAAGKSGADGMVDRLDGERALSGVELDAYEAFYQGRWSRPNADPAAPGNAVYVRSDGRVGDSSVEYLVSTVTGIGKPVPTHLWAFEVVLRFNVHRIVDRFLTEAVERQYVRDLRDYYKDTNPQTPPPALPTTYAWWSRVLAGARGIMRAQDIALYTGEAATGIVHYGVENRHPMTQEHRYAAKALLTRLGLLNDYAHERKGIKGNVVATPTAEMVGRSVNAGLLANHAEGSQIALTPAQLAERRTQRISWDGTEFVVPDTLAEHIAHAMDRYAPLGKYLGDTLRDRGRAAQFFGSVRELVAILKGTLVTGGPNAYVGTALAGLSWLGGASPGEMAQWFIGGTLFTFAPRISGYVNNLVSGIVYQPSALGFKVPFTLASPGAARVTAETVTFRRWGGALGRAERLLEGVAKNAVGNLDADAFVTKSGRVYTLGMVARISHEYGLDGTQARFESEEAIDQRLQRLDAEYQKSSTMSAFWRLVRAMYGRNVLAENYRKVYESLDSYVRHALLIRGLEDGLTPDEAVKRALLVTYDYSSLSPVDVWMNRVFLFWMYTRRSIDLTLYTLATNPNRILGWFRLMRMQDQTSGYQDVNEDNEQQSEPVPEYAQTRPALGYLPLAGTNNIALKLMLVEPPGALAVRTLMEFGLADVPTVASRVNPYAQSVVGLAYNTATGQYVDFYRGKDVLDDPYSNIVSPWLLRYDAAFGGGSVANALNVLPVEENDPTRRYDPSAPMTFQVTGNGPRLAWAVMRQTVPGMSTVLQQRETADRGDSLGDQMLEAMYAWFGKADAVILNPDAPRFEAVGAAPRIGYGRRVELARQFGLTPAVIVSPYNARTRAVRTYDAWLRERMMKLREYRAFEQAPTGAQVPLDTVRASENLGIKPPERSGIEESR